MPPPAEHLRADRRHPLPNPPGAARRPVQRGERLLEIVGLFVGGQSWSASELAGCFAVSERTILRDMQALEQAGFVARPGKRHKRGYRVSQDAAWVSPRLSLREVTTLLALVQRGSESAGDSAEASELAVARAAIDKILLPLPDDKRDRLRPVHNLLGECDAAMRRWLCSQNWLPTLLEAIADHRPLRATLHDNGGEAGGGLLVFIPNGLLIRDGQWIVPALPIGDSERWQIEVDRVAGLQFDVPADG